MWGCPASAQAHDHSVGRGYQYLGGRSGAPALLHPREIRGHGHGHDHDHDYHDNTELKTIFWSYMPLLIFLTGIWEWFYLYFKLKGPVNQPNKLETQDYIY